MTDARQEEGHGQGQEARREAAQARRGRRDQGRLVAELLRPWWKREPGRRWLGHEVRTLTAAGFRVEQRIDREARLCLEVTRAAECYAVSFGHDRDELVPWFQVDHLDSLGATRRTFGRNGSIDAAIAVLPQGWVVPPVPSSTIVLPAAWERGPLVGASQIVLGVGRPGVFLPLSITGTPEAARLMAASVPYASAFPHRRPGLWASVDGTAGAAEQPDPAAVERMLVERTRRSPRTLRRVLAEGGLGILVRAVGNSVRWQVIASAGDGRLEFVQHEDVVAGDRRSRAPFAHQLGVKRVTLVGCGAVGWSVAELLARAGVGQFTLFDPDFVQEQNLFRLGAQPDDIGRPKVDALGYRLRAIAPGVEVDAHRSTQGYEAGARAILLGEPDLIIDLTADLSTDETNLAALGRPCPAIFGWVSNGVRAARLFRVRPFESACYECVREAEPTDIPTDGPVGRTWTGAMHDAELFASAVARMAVRTLVDEPVSAANPDHVVLRYGGVTPTAQQIEIARRRDCSRCGRTGRGG